MWSFLQPQDSMQAQLLMAKQKCSFVVDNDMGVLGNISDTEVS
jgi:hypothetical protein